MKVVLQRTGPATVVVEEKVIGSIQKGYMLLVGVTHTDTEEDAKYLAKKIAELRLWEDDDGKMNHSIIEVGGEILSISQFTLYANSRKGRRPSFIEAAKPEYAEPIWETFNLLLEQQGIHVETGIFGATMEVSLTNNGPVTIVLDTNE